MKKITQDLFHEFNFLTNLAYTSDGKILFVKTKQNVEKNNYESHIFQLKDGQIRQLTSGKSERYFVVENDDSILFSANRSEDKTTHTEFYRLDLKNGGEASLAFSVPIGVNSIKDIGDFYLASGSSDLYCPDYHLLTKEEQLEYEKKKEEENDYEVVDEYPFFFNGAGFINKTRTALYLIDKKTLLVKRIGPATLNVESFDYKDGIIMITGIDYTAVMDKWSQVYRYDIKADKFECLYPAHDMLIRGVKFYNDKIMITGTYGKEYGVTESSKLWFFEDGKMIPFIDNDITMWNSVGTDSKWGRGKGMDIVDGVLYLVPTICGNANLNKVVGTDYVPLTKIKGSICDFCVGKDDIIVIAMQDQKLQEIYRVEKDGSLTQLSNINTPIMEDYYVAKPERVLVKKATGDVEGWVLKPYDYDPNKKYPAILDIHGGPRSAYGVVYYHEMQYWASCGFIVLYCNPHGSDSYGNDFADIRQEKYGTIDYEDIMDFTDEVIKLYPVDEKRVAVTGGSYGGFMTNWIIGHTNRFCCAASQRSISNWMSMMLASDYGLDV
ncbi:MAG: S9 family peptidase, partial [Erysipelotrichaceae bacterium]|nr:S9 family peptidase [Erysipelotrichaceae bacterium]